MTTSNDPTSSSSINKICRASLQNNIGAVLLQNGSMIEEATERFYASIIVSSTHVNIQSSCFTKRTSTSCDDDDDELCHIMDNFFESCSIGGENKKYINSDDSSSPHHSMIHNDEFHERSVMKHSFDSQRHVMRRNSKIVWENLIHADYHALQWFYNRLCREQSSSKNLLGSSSSNLHSTSSGPVSATNVIINTQSSSLPPSSSNTHSHYNDHFELDHIIPLGFEYISTPIFVPYSSSCSSSSSHTNYVHNQIQQWLDELTYAYNARCAAILNLTRLRLEQHRYKTKVPALKQAQTQQYSERDEDNEDNNRKNDIELYSLSSIAGLLSKALETPYIHDMDDIERKFRRTSNKLSYSSVSSPSEAKVSDEDETEHTTYKRIGTKDSKQLICPSLQMIVYNNLGIIKCIQNRLNEALSCFEKALQIFTDSKSDIKTFRYEEEINHDAHDCFSKSRNSIRNLDSKTDWIHKAPIVPLEYLHLTTLSNLSRICVRMNDNIRSNQIITDINSTHFTIPSFYHPQNRRPSLINHPPNNNNNSIHHYNHLQTRIKWIQSTSQTYIQGLLNQRLEQHQSALEFYNKALYSCRKEVGHNHIYVATILEKKGSVLFDQRKLQTSMLSYLASLKIYDYLYEECNQIEFYSVEKSRILYAVGRTLHDREEYSDALTVYEKALSFHRVKGSTESETDGALSGAPGKIKSNVDAVTILCNIGRLYHMLGDLNNALKANLDIVDLAIEMVGGGETAESHPFVRNRLVILGNLYVEAGMLEEAMEVFARVVRNGDGGSDLLVLSHARPGMEDVDTSAYDARGAVKSSSNLGMSFFSHAAAA